MWNEIVLSITLVGSSLLLNFSQQSILELKPVIDT